MSKFQEKRKHPRIDVALKVFKPGGEILGITKNISFGGCFIKTKEDTNNAFNISFFLPPDYRVVKASCEVIWRNNNGIEAAWTLDIKDRSILHEWLFLKGLELEQCREYRGKIK